MLLNHATGYSLDAQTVRDHAPTAGEVGYLFANCASLRFWLSPKKGGLQKVHLEWRHEDAPDDICRDELFLTRQGFSRPGQFWSRDIKLDAGSRRWERLPPNEDCGHRALLHSSMELLAWLAAPRKEQLRLAASAAAHFWALGEELHAAPLAGGKSLGPILQANIRAVRKGTAGGRRYWPAKAEAALMRMGYPIPIGTPP